jgi:hypothetical protein
MVYISTWLRAVGMFYRSVAPFTLGITALLLGAGQLPALLEGVATGSLPLLVLIKLSTLPAVWYLAERARPDQYWFFYNLGISRAALWLGVALADTALFTGLALANEAAFRALT